MPPQITGTSTTAPAISFSRVATSGTGALGNGLSFSPTFSPDGTKIAFISLADNLVGGDSNGRPDIFVKDLATGVVTRVSEQGWGWPGSYYPQYYPISFSPDGSKISFGGFSSDQSAVNTYVRDLTTGALTEIKVRTPSSVPRMSLWSAFSPDGTKLLFSSDDISRVGGVTGPSIFLKDLVTGDVTRLTTGSTDYRPIFSPDGTSFVFATADGLLPQDTNGRYDIYLQNIATGGRTLISAAFGGEPANSINWASVLGFSPDGRKILFQSDGSNLVAGDTTNTDIFLKDLISGVVERVSVASNGNQSSSGGEHGDFSFDGSQVAFASGAAGLVPGGVFSDGDIFVKVLSTGQVIQITSSADPAIPNARAPAFSADGSMIAFNTDLTDMFHVAEVFIAARGYREGQAPVIVAGGLTLSDSGSATLESATVKVASGFKAGDLLSVSTTGTGIAASFDSGTGVLSLSGHDTLANYQTVMRNVAFSSSSRLAGDFGASRVITWSANNGATTGNLASTTIRTAALPTAGDFDASGKADIVLQGTDGAVNVLMMNGTSLSSRTAPTSNPGRSWQARGTGDFDGDGRSDILFQNTDGRVAVWQMYGNGFVKGAAISDNPGTGWDVIGSGDFNGDGKSDILFQNDDRRAAVWLMNGLSLTMGAAVATNPGTTVHARGAGDFNGDGKSDILFQNENGQISIFFMEGVNRIGGGAVATNPGSDWRVIGAGDFNGDGKSDILMQHSDGRAGVWLMNGTSLSLGDVVAPNPGTSWHVLGAFDANGDDKADILWQNDSGEIAEWFMNGTAKVGGDTLASNPGANWRVASFGAAAVSPGDFDGDGKGDLLWQNNDGTSAIWFLNGAALSGSVTLAPNSGAAWHATGSGDFNGDGKADILWQHNDGTAAIWTMSGATRIGGDELAPKPGNAWHVKSAADFNGDGKADILWQHNDGSAAIWIMNGILRTGGDTLVPNPGAAWHVMDAGDFNGDGKSDILWQHDDGRAAIWLMNGTAKIADAILSANPGASWHVIGAGDFNGDGKSDILWQNDDGRAAVWLIDGLSLAGDGIVSTSPGANWRLKGALDTNADGRSDVLLHNDVTGEAGVWLMSGLTQTGTGTLAGFGAYWHPIASAG